MSSDYPFGASFFLPSDGFQEDLSKMAELGFSVARIEWPRNGFWEAVETKPGVYDFSVLDAAIEAAHKTGVKLALQVGAIYPPRWVRTELGEEGVVNNKGLRPHPWEIYSVCYDNPAIIERAKEFIKKSVARYRDSDALYGWISWNEPRLSRTDITCYCKHTQKKFQAWLSRKYSTVEELNEAWGDYPCWSAWEEVEAPRRGSFYFASYTAWQDWRTFIDDNFASIVNWVSQTIKEQDPNHPTKVNVIFPLVNTTPVGVDSWKMSKASDIFGTSIFIYTFEGEYPYLVSQNMDFVRSCAKACDREAWVDEIQAGPNFTTHQTLKGVSPSLAALWPWQSIARGIKGFTYWCWRPRFRDTEAGEYGLVARDGSVLDRTLAASEVAKFVKKNSELLSSLESVSDIAIYHSMPIQHTMFAEGTDQHIQPFQDVKEGGLKAYYRDAVRGAYKIIRDLKLTCDFVNSESILGKNISQYKALVLPYAYLLNPEVANAVKAYVSSGGLLISEYPSVLKDENGHSYIDVPGAGLDEMFGCCETDMSHTDDGEVASGKIGDLSFELPSLASKQKQRFKVIDDTATIVARFSSDGSPALISNRFGKGRTLLFAFPVFATYINESTNDLLNLLSVWLRTQNAVIPRIEIYGLTLDLEKGVEIGVLKPKDQNNKLVAVLINHNKKAIDFGIMCNESGMKSFTNLRTEELLDIDNPLFKEKLQFHLEPMDALVLLGEGSTKK